MYSLPAFGSSVTTHADLRLVYPQPFVPDRQIDLDLAQKPTFDLLGALYQIAYLIGFQVGYRLFRIGLHRK